MFSLMFSTCIPSWDVSGMLFVKQLSSRGGVLTTIVSMLFKNIVSGFSQEACIDELLISVSNDANVG